MLKPQITVLSLLTIIVCSSIPEISVAQVKPMAPQKAWKRPVTYIMPTPRVKPRKYVYQIETSQVTRATHGQLLPSQVAITTKPASGDGTVSQKEKSKRSIASEDN